jgi:hypothetical protein
MMALAGLRRRHCLSRRHRRAGAIELIATSTIGLNRIIAASTVDISRCAASRAARPLRGVEVSTNSETSSAPVQIETNLFPPITADCTFSLVPPPAISILTAA